MKTWKSEVFEWGIALMLGIAIIWLIRTTFLTTYHIQGDSMLPNLHSNDKVVVLRNTTIDYGDIVILHRSQDSDIVKRVIGLPGDKIEFKENAIYINGEYQEETYIVSESFTLKDSEVVVPEDSYFVLGDNRDRSLDSRQLGEFRSSQIVGEVKMIYFPLGHLQWISY
ncbi:signal peptidase I [Chryseomicrobium palamuruense]|uniref:Signal peptidase I n=1 Tax=Chryseomicrobium palamuruense TaxID=682973 RepID=A0ABV8USQ9_9BACL